VGHDHSHSRPLPPTPPRIRRRLAYTIAPFIGLTLGFLLLLWPGGDGPLSGVDVELPPQFDGTVVGVEEGACEAPPNTNFVCSVIEVRVETGADEGETFTFDQSVGAGSRTLAVDDPVVVARGATDAQGAGGGEYYFVDYRRGAPLVALALLFVVVVVAISRLRGALSLLGLAISLLVLVRFVMPAILEGSDPVLVAVTGSAAIMFVTLYLAHGVNVRTTTAILGTLASLALTGGLAIAFVELARFTGFGSEEATFLQISAEQVNLEGLLLGGIIIGTLGVLDDVTVTQASAVWELRVANPAYSFRRLYSSALRIGRDHIASTVNTLVLAYVGASLPLLILFTISSRPLGGILTTEVVAEEIVRTLVGSIGLVASVPITTALAAAVVSADPGTDESPPKEPPEDDDDSGFKVPKREAEWRD